MSIVGYSGLPGSGKSYGVVENVIIPSLEVGRHIITNIPLKLGRLADDYPDGKITVFNNQDAENDPQFFSLDKHPAGAIWIIDEAWRFWKSGMKATNIPQCQKEFFTEHRHAVGEDGRTNEIVLVTQDLAQLCAFVRQLVEETYRAVKLTAIGQRNKYRVDVYMGAATGQKPGTPMRQLYGKYKPEIYQYYKSHTRNKTDFAAGMEEKADDRANILKSPFIKFGMPIAIIIMAYGGWKAFSYFQVPDPDQSPQAQQQPVTTTTGNPAANGTNTSATTTTTNSTGTTRKVRTRLPENAQRQQQYEIEQGWLPVSDKWRIVGEVNGIYWIWGEHGTRKIHSRVCATFRKTGEPYCVIEGQLVTWYSYKEPQRYDEYERESRNYLEVGREDPGA
ncbi:zonular occludens toxin domain-containing protein [Marinobacter zhanjiangensis]|uniref:Zona occludens toxin N-terminal domain-containing protein n=1 Tax=Marinobacter zhanjiangensis TaxID=578215 RepID=A0ABQ3BAQ0_9GAMM|nr:zonular occludens toxin domain-containing protein [Marinobacter zhanjiangensis]GGY83555.1 hypothetical protein GCM10007071_33580 [Marinobacter zhanjiangensis]